MKIRYPLTLAGIPAAVLAALQEIRSALSPDIGGISIQDHCFAALLTIDFVSGQQITPMPSPLRGGSIPKGFSVIAAWDSAGTPIMNPECIFDENVSGSGKFAVTLIAKEIAGGALTEQPADYEGTVAGILWGG